MRREKLPGVRGNGVHENSVSMRSRYLVKPELIDRMITCTQCTETIVVPVAPESRLPFASKPSEGKQAMPTAEQIHKEREEALLHRSS